MSTAAPSTRRGAITHDHDAPFDPWATALIIALTIALIAVATLMR